MPAARFMKMKNWPNAMLYLPEGSLWHPEYAFRESSGIRCVAVAKNLSYPVLAVVCVFNSTENLT